MVRSREEISCELKGWTNLMKKRLLAIMLAAGMILSLAACGGSGSGGAIQSGAGSAETQDTIKDKTKDPGGTARPETDAPSREDPGEAPDLSAWADGFLQSLGEDAPAVDALPPGLIPEFYPGIEDHHAIQLDVRVAMISAVSFELALVEAEGQASAEAIAEILQARVNSQIESGAFYPQAVEAWQNAEIIVCGNVAALIVAADFQDQAVASFRDLLGI